MRAPPPRSVTLVRGRASAAAGAALTAALFAISTSGCLSNEYRISKDELRRLASVEPASRGRSVRVIQTLGDRRSDAIAPARPEPPVVAEPAEVEQTELDVDLNGSVGGGGGGRPARATGSHGAPSGG
ncbi:MAG TPA: hypothetical protein VHE35_10580, partial [Kofleriaceae bacterium]|nr:hypothetical protein [Kofleriaceae bacterium]